MTTTRWSRSTWKLSQVSRCGNVDEWERARRVTLKILLVSAAVAWFTIGCLLIEKASADHDGEDQAWRRQDLASCAPAWDASNPRIVTWDGKNLHEQPDDVRSLFYRVWGQGNPQGDHHLKRWRWEYECEHPQPAANNRTPGIRSEASRSPAQGTSTPAESSVSGAPDSAAMTGDCPPVNPRGEATQHLGRINDGWHCHSDDELPAGAKPARPDFRYGRVYHQHVGGH